MPLASAIELPERYRVTRHIASGGMATVWEVEDLLLGRVVAVKVLASHFAADPGARARFQREARTAARVSEHPHIATIYDTGEHADTTYIVMEYFSGGTVADRLRAAKDGGAPVPRDVALRWLREAALALDAAHGADIVHRDVKPANLLLDAKDRLAVGDFGIARLADDTQMTQTGQVLGTAAYLSPEQAMGQPATAASDRYALAVVAYELLTGQRPFAGGPVTAQARQHVEDQPEKATNAAPDLPKPIDAVFARGLAKEAHERPATAVALVEEIERALSTATAPTKRVDSTRAMGAVPPAAAAGAAAGAGAAAAADPPAPPTPPPAPTRGGRPREPARAAAAGAAGAAPRAPETADVPRRAPDVPPVVADRASHPRRSAPPWLPIGVAAAAVAAVVLAIALASGGGGGDGERASTTTPKKSQPAASSDAQQDEPSSDAQASPPPPASPPPAPSTGTSTGTGTGKMTAAQARRLNDRGYSLLTGGNAAGAVPLLQRSVEGFRDAEALTDIHYHYALYNLGEALMATGKPAEAIEYLEERLERSNDRRGLVRQTLAKAKAQAGETGGGDG